MKIKKSRIVLFAGIILAAFLITGCEDAETASALVVDPDSSDLSGVGATVMLTASVVDDAAATNRSNQVILPLTWKVSNPSLGGILSSRGYSAVYESRGKVGQNIVFVEDTYGREGLAVINQD